MDWFAILGSGTGVLFVFSEIQVNGELFTEAYATQLKEISNLELVGVVESVSNNQGIYLNNEEGKTLFIRRMKKFIEKQDASTYDFKLKFYYNSSLGQGESLDYLKNNNINGLITHADTTELTSEDDTFLDNILC